MNKHEICSQLLATLGVGLTLVAVPTMAAKPGGRIDESLCDTWARLPGVHLSPAERQRPNNLRCGRLGKVQPGGVQVFE